MAGLKNHPGMWLNDAAAAAFNAFEDKYGVITTNSAGRTKAEQQGLINLWHSPNRPSWLFRPAEPADTSPHVRNGGQAVDIRDYNTWKDELAEFGFSWYGSSDPVHFNHNGDRRWLDANGGRDQVTADRQSWLNSRGWKLQVDGIEGPATRQAYKEYQTQLAQILGVTLVADGKWGPMTQAAHQRFYDMVHGAPTGRPSNKSSGQLSYADIQTALNRRGYGLTVDNVWGPRSSNALADFQRKNGLNADRIVGPATWDKLNRY